jgi:hypothetical protein
VELTPREREPTPWWLKALLGLVAVNLVGFATFVAVVVL